MKKGFNANVHLTNGKTIFLHNLEYLTTSEVTVTVEFTNEFNERIFEENCEEICKETEGARLKRKDRLFVLFLPTDVRVSYCAMFM